jgi:tRNA threonylcarbamoyladenosine biosynthesis protein TsaB
MIVLGIDSSTDRLGIGLADEQGIVFEDTLDSAQEHASRIIGMIDSVLSQAKLSKDVLGGVAVADGPGSFTGLRIGMAAAKGIALAMNLPLVGISPFEVVARRLMTDNESFYLAATVRKGELYLCQIREGIDIRRNIFLINQDDLPDKVGPKPVGFIGRRPDGWGNLIDNHIPAEKTVISGGELAHLGVELISAGKTSDPATLEPLYIAPSQAEMKFGRK